MVVKVAVVKVGVKVLVLVVVVVLRVCALIPRPSMGATYIIE